MERYLNKLLLAFLFLTIPFAMFGQIKGQMKGSIEFGPLLGPNLGFQISFEPKYNLTDRSNLGLRIELPGFFGRDVNLNDETLFYDNESSNLAGIFLPITYEYYYGKRGKSFQPYVGGGFGYFKMNGNMTIYPTGQLDNGITASSKGTVAAIAKFGFEWGKFRYGFAFTYVPDTDLVSETGMTIGQVRDYYVHFNIGLTLFGGKWKDQK